MGVLRADADNVSLLSLTLLLPTKNDTIDGQPVICLPKRTVEVKDISFSPDELDFYRGLEKQTVMDLSKFNSDAGAVPDYMNLLLLLLRLR